jgi:hypothetical protein
MYKLMTGIIVTENDRITVLRAASLKYTLRGFAWLSGRRHYFLCSLGAVRRFARHEGKKETEVV